MRLTTTGRRTGRERSVIVGYFEDGPNLVTLAMNGWGEGEPAWWLNLQARPEVEVELVDGHRLVTGRAAEGEERARLWACWEEIDENLNAYAALRPTETAVVVLESRSEADDASVPS
jgi:deazaflavin-dependent oxidoreductase (nitroreductase family)